MTKQELQKEIQDKVKPGVKPSDLKKLKRSKSAGDIPKAPPSPSSVPLTRSQSNQPFTDPKYPYTTLISQQEELDQLKKETQAKSDTISLLRKKIESLEQNPPSQLLQEQLTEKQKQIESLKELLEVINTELTSLKAEKSIILDDNLFLKHQSLKDWFSQYQKTKKLDIELVENIDEASQELISQDNQISNLRKEVNQLKLTNQQLQKDLNLAERLAEMRKVPLPGDETNLNSLNPLIISFLVIWFISLLNNSWKYHFKDNP